ncbi:MAG TPA: 50S ribosomal protein L11 methyltransferase [Streptosporangiaceae bacterium]
MTPDEFVRTTTKLAPVAFVPEIRLHQTADLYDLWPLTEAESGHNGLPPPFWGVPWPGGQALARYLLDHPDLVAGRRVLDFGSGSGLVAIAAVKAGAAAVIAAEPDGFAAAAIAVNAAANGVTVTVCPDAAAAISLGATPDVVVAGDVWYEKELADLIMGIAARAADGGADVFAGDIGRTYFPRAQFRLIASYEVPANPELENAELVTASVWRADAPVRATPVSQP